MVPDELIKKMEERYSDENIDTIDGLKIDFEQGWVHLRKSNTEPIIRIYTESNTMENATDLAERFEKELTALI